MEQVAQLADQYWTASAPVHLQQNYLRPEPMEVVVQLADQYSPASLRVHLEQSYLCPELMEQVVQLAEQYYLTANSRGDRRGLRGFEMMSGEGRPKWLSCPESPAACPK
jgi:hypothetical protein